jgi:hypothetical protein
MQGSCGRTMAASQTELRKAVHIFLVITLCMAKASILRTCLSLNYSPHMKVGGIKKAVLILLVIELMFQKGKDVTTHIFPVFYRLILA